MTATIARTVVYRHTCDCPNTNRQLMPGEEPEHRFDVDGEPFPWHITEDGATFHRTKNGLYLVAVRIVPFLRANNAPVPFSHDWPVPAAPRLGDRPFPWAITGPLIYTLDERGEPTIELTFVAADVDTDGEISVEKPTREVTI